MKLNQKALIELLKSAVRFLYFGVLGLIGAFLTSLAANASLSNSYVDIGSLRLPTGLIITGVVAAALKAIDRYKHYDPTASKGITPV